jgi:hypothetical protein
VHYNYIHTYHSRFIPEEVAEVSQTFFRDTHNLKTIAKLEKSKMYGIDASRINHVTLDIVSLRSDVALYTLWYSLGGTPTFLAMRNTADVTGNKPHRRMMYYYII